MKAGESREDIEGLYYVGATDAAAALDLSDLPEGVAIYRREIPLLPEDEARGAVPASELRVPLGEDAWPSVLEPVREEGS
jgi:hypothetical protein